LQNFIHFLVQHGYAVLFAWVLGEQIGLPVPAAPLLLAAGAMAGGGLLRFFPVLGISILACLLGDLIWYFIGRSRGGAVLSVLCRFSLSPDSCVRRTADLFFRQGSRALLIAKFMPGLSLIAPPLAGMSRISLLRFLIFDGLGSLLWTGSFVGLGYLFTDQIERVGEYVMRTGASLGIFVGGGSAAYILWKVFERQRFLRTLRMARITPEELKNKLDAREEILLLDVRHPLEFEADPYMIPGALYVPLEELEQDSGPVEPGGREVVLYCN
jgi:membrane protein DedA with SNARE-associated domain